MRAGIGLDVGSTAVRLAAVRLTRTGPALLAYQRESLAVPDPQNDVIDPMAITAAVKSLLRGQRLPKAPVSVGMVNQRMVAREVELPWVPEKELKTALPMLASDLLPMAVEESVLDFLPAEEIIDKDGSRTLRGLLLAANEDIVTAAVEAIERAGLTVDRVDFSPLGALHAVCNRSAIGAEALIDVGANTTSLVVHEGSRPTFVRVMARGGASVTESLADQFHIDYEQAQAWKQGVGALWPTMSPGDQHSTRQALDAATGSLIEEIRSSVMFFRTNNGRSIDRVWLIGGGAAQFGLDFQLRDALHTDVRRADPGRNLGLVTEVPLADSEAATAIGLALAVAA